MKSGERINAYLAHKGIASRREADAAIAAGLVFVNGKRAGVWYQPGTNAHHRWGETDFLFPESLTHGAARLEVELRVVQPGWNEFRYELWGQGRMR